MNNLFYSVWGYRPVTEPDVPLSTLMDNALDSSVEPTNDYRFNPIMSLKNEYRKNYTNNLQLNGFVEYEFIKGLKLKVSGGYTYDARSNDTFNNSKTRYGSPISTDKVNAQVVRQQRLTWLNENVLTYQVNINKKHFFNSLLGITLQNSDYEYYSFKTTNIPNESLGMAGMSEGIPSTTSSEKSSWSMMSYLGRVNYNYMSKYYATASFRVDGSSKFAKKNRYGLFPSASLAWNFSEEDFMKEYKSILSNGKLRASWGLTGNNRVGEYEAYALLKMAKAASNNLPSGVYPFENNQNSIGMVPISLANKDLKWETTEQWNVGLDLGFFDERIGINVDWYMKTTRDLLLDASLPYSTGYYSAMKNVGKVRNSGLEFTLNTININRNGFRWSTNFNIAFNKNKVLELAENQTSLLTSANAFIVAAGIHAGLVVVRAFALTHQNAHSLRHIHRYAVKAAVRGTRQRVHRVLFRPLFRVFHALCNRIRMALSAVHKVVVQKRLFYIFRHVRFALTGFAAPVNHAVQVALIQCFFLPVQCRYAQLHAGVFHAHVLDEFMVQLT